jgi:hypothetical protein
MATAGEIREIDGAQHGGMIAAGEVEIAQGEG